MARKTHKPGTIYILSNNEYKGKLKIGFTTGDLVDRVNRLNRETSQLGIFKVEWSMEVDSVGVAEDVVHYLLKSYRVRNNKEFFEISLNRAIKACEHVSRAIFESEVVRPKFTPEDWQPIIASYKDKFIKETIKLCLKEGRVGEPLRKRFGTIRYKFKGFNIISLYFTKNHVNVVTHIEKPHGEKLIKKQFPVSKVWNIQLKEWGAWNSGGYSFKIQNNTQFEILKSWLALGKKGKIPNRSGVSNI